MSMDLPFEPTEPTPLLDADVRYSGGVVVMASYVETPVGRSASLVFRFTDPQGQFYPPVVLVLDDRRMADLAGLVAQAADQALQGARGAS
jgi:hypothetical protein